MHEYNSLYFRKLISRLIETVFTLKSFYLQISLKTFIFLQNKQMKRVTQINNAYKISSLYSSPTLLVNWYNLPINRGYRYSSLESITSLYSFQCSLKIIHQIKNKTLYKTTAFSIKQTHVQNIYKNYYLQTSAIKMIFTKLSL